MIAAHAEAVGVTLVTRDAAVKEPENRRLEDRQLVGLSYATRQAALRQASERSVPVPSHRAPKVASPSRS